MSPEEEQALDATLLRIAERHGHVSNLLQTLALAPEGLAAFADLGSYTAYGSHLTEKQRQLANVIAGKDVHYCWSHHAPLAMAAGVTEAQLMAIREGRIPRDLDTADSTVCEYALEIAASRRLPPRIMELLQSCFTPPPDRRYRPADRAGDVGRGPVARTRRAAGTAGDTGAGAGLAACEDR